MAEPDGWIRLHPFSPLIDAGKFVFAAVFLTVQLWADQASEFAPGLGLVVGVGAALVLVGMLAFAYARVAWRFRMYRVTPARVELKTGILFRSYRHLPFDRMESVDTAQPFIPRLLGLAEVRIEAISNQGSEVRLRYLAFEEAERLRLDLSDRRHPVPAEQPLPPAPAQLILKVPMRELFIGYVVLPGLTGAVLVIPCVVVTGVVASWREALVVLAIGLPAVVAFAGSAVARCERLWDFRLEDATDELVVNRGLLNLTTQRIATGRIQALRIDQPLLWRPYKRYRVVVDVAGYRGAGKEGAGSSNLLPIAPYEVVRYLVHRLEIREDLAALPFRPVPRRARWRSLRWRGLAVAWTDTHAVIRSGVLWRSTTVVPHHRVQSARVTQGPVQRRLRLATLHLDTAGTHIKAFAAHRAERDAVELADTSVRRARQRAGFGASPDTPEHVSSAER